MRYTRAATMALLALAVVLAPTSVSVAAEPGETTMQERVDEVIAEFGGEQVDWNQVSWDEGEIVLTLAEEESRANTARVAAAAATDKCASGKYCVYPKIGYGGNQLAFSACPATQTSFSVIGSIRSIKNDRASNTVRAYAGSTLRATLAAGTGNTNISGITKVTCS